MKEKLKQAVRFIANPRLLFCFGLAWIMTNGWSYILLVVGSLLGVSWMTAVASGYLAFLWLPVSPEKICTVAIAMFLLRVLFPNDQRTLAVLKNWYGKAKGQIAGKGRSRMGKKPQKSGKQFANRKTLRGCFGSIRRDANRTSHTSFRGDQNWNEPL